MHGLGYHILNYEIQSEKESVENKNELFENGRDPSHNEGFECLEQIMKWVGQ